jgi:hypothetical protein
MERQVKPGGAFRHGRPWDLGAATLILLALGIALVWLVKMPILQCADEDNHYDYALTLAAAGRPITGAEGDTQPDTHPSLRYLMVRTKTFPIRFDENERVPAGYGTSSYFRDIDRHAPTVDAQAFRAGPISPVPYIAKLYPILYYGLVAGVVRVTQFVLPGSIVAPFFAARLLSVALMTIALTFSWLLLKLLCSSRVQALTLLGCTALFPLTTQIGACIQPDNLSFALVAAALYFATRLTRSPSDLRYGAALVGIFTLLVATKRQYFLAVYLATAFALAVTLARKPCARRRSGIQLAALTLFPAVAYLTTAMLMKVPATAHQFCSGTLADIPKRLANLGATTAASYLAAGVSQAAEAFAGGSALWMFWLSFGSFVNKMVLGAPLVTDVVFRFLAAGTLLLSLLAVWRLITVAPRLLAVARRRSVGSALRVASGNIAVNAYFAFALILCAYEVWVGGVVAIQGRYWLPFLPVIWYIVFAVAPRALPRNFARASSAVTAGGLFAYLILANLSIPLSLDRRYYAAPEQRLAADETFLEGFNGVGGAVHTFGPVRRGTRITLHGLAFDARTPGPATAVVFRIDSKLRVPAVAEPSHSFACENTDTALTRIGFTVSLPTDDLVSGSHQIRVLLTTPWSQVPFDSGYRGVISVTP